MTNDWKLYEGTDSGFDGVLRGGVVWKYDNPDNGGDEELKMRQQIELIVTNNNKALRVCWVLVK